MGETTQLPSPDNGNGNLLLVQDAQLTAAGTLESLSFFVTTPAGNLILGVYDASGTGGGPGKLLASTAPFTPVAGWNTQPVVVPVKLAVGTYWLAYLPSDNNLAFLKENARGTAYWYAFTFGALPSTFNLAAASTNVTHWSFYGSLNALPASQISLAWDAPAVIGGYFLYWNSANSGTFMGSHNVGLAYNYTITGLTPNTLYYWFVQPYNPAGAFVGCASPVLSGTSGGSGNLAVSWSAPSAVTGYTVFYGTTSGDYTASQNAGTGLSFTVKGLASGLTYYFRVFSLDAAGNPSCPTAEVSFMAP
jgi:hypothetical protein